MKTLIAIAAIFSLTSIISVTYAQQGCNGNRILVYKGGKGCGCTCKKKCISTDELQVYLDNGWSTWGCFNCCWVSNDAEDTSMPTGLAEVYTHPDAHLLTVSFTLATESDVTIEVTDMAGKLVATVANEFFQDGDNELIWDRSTLSPGMYLLTLQAGSERDARTLSVLN